MPIWIKHLFLLPLNCTEIVFILIQSYLILLHFTDTAVFYFYFFFTNGRLLSALHWASLLLFFQQHLLTLCLWHILIILALFQTFIIIFVMVICGQWSLILLSHKDYDSLKAQVMVKHSLTIKYFLFKSVYNLFRYNTIVHIIVHCIVSTELLHPLRNQNVQESHFAAYLLLRRAGTAPARRPELRDWWAGAGAAPQISPLDTQKSAADFPAGGDMHFRAKVVQTLSSHGRLRGLRTEQQPGPWVFADLPCTQEMGIALSCPRRTFSAS